MVQNFLNPYETYSLGYGEVNIESTYTSFVMRNETLISTQNGGEIRYFINEGERVKRGHKIAEIQIMDTISPLANTSLASEPEVAGLLSVSPESVEGEIEALRDEIIHNINQHNLLKVSSLKEELVLKIEKRDRLTKTAGLNDIKVQPFTEKTIGSDSLGTGQVLDVRSLDSGIVTFTSDGYETILNVERLYDIDYYQLMGQPIIVNDLKTDQVAPNADIYKLVDNSTWYVVSIISQEEIKVYSELTGENVSVDFNNEKIIGKVYDAFETGNQSGALVIQFKNQVSGFYNERKKNLNVTRENYRGLKVPKDAIIKEAGVEGVFVVGLENKVKFVPVKSIGSNEDDVIVYENRFYENSNGEVVEIKTVDQYSIVVRNPGNVSEGEIIY